MDADANGTSVEAAQTIDAGNEVKFNSPDTPLLIWQASALNNYRESGIIVT